jgi:hypothetical protein
MCTIIESCAQTLQTYGALHTQTLVQEGTIEMEEQKAGFEEQRVAEISAECHSMKDRLQSLQEVIDAKGEAKQQLEADIRANTQLHVCLETSCMAGDEDEHEELHGEAVRARPARPLSQRQPTDWRCVRRACRRSGSRPRRRRLPRSRRCA